MFKIYLKILRMLKAITQGIFLILLNPKLIKKKYVIYLFSSRFGHFLQNTEVFLRNKIKKKECIFIKEDKVDNIQLLKLWSKKIDISPIVVGDFLRFFLRKNVIHLRTITVPQDKNFLKTRFIKKISLEPKKEIINKFKKNDYITFSLRDSSYNQKIHHNGLRDNFRDSNIDDFKKIIISSNIKKKNIFIKVNNSFKKTKIKNFYDYGFDKSYDLETALYLIKNSKYHIGSNTAIDTYAALIDQKVLLFNTMLGTSFPTRLYTSPSLFVPLNIFYKKNKRLVPLSKQIELLQHCEKKFNSSDLTKDALNYFGIFIKSNSTDEMMNIFKEFKKLIKRSFLLNKKEKKIQESFWNIYPTKWYKIDKGQKIIFNSPNFRGNLILSSYYVSKYKNFLT